MWSLNNSISQICSKCAYAKIASMHANTIQSGGMTDFGNGIWQRNSSAFSDLLLKIVYWLGTVSYIGVGMVQISVYFARKSVNIL